MSYAVQKIYRFDNFTIDPVRRKLQRGDQRVQLPAKAFDLLVVMLENNGRLIEREELFQLLWPGQIVEESNLAVNVSALRKALGLLSRKAVPSWARGELLVEWANAKKKQT